MGANASTKRQRHTMTHTGIVNQVNREQYEGRQSPWGRIADSLNQYNRDFPWNPFGNRRDLRVAGHSAK